MNSLCAPTLRRPSAAQLLASASLFLAFSLHAAPARADVPLPRSATALVSELGVAGLLADVTQTGQGDVAPLRLANVDDLAAHTALDAEVRVRASAPHHLSALEPGADVVRSSVFHRERLGAAFAQGPVDAHVQFQASGAFGDSDPGTSQLPQVGLQQAVVRLQAPTLKWLSAEMGRMVLDYGAGRMIGAYDFQAASNVFDGMRVRMSYQKYLDIDLIAVKLRRNSTEPDQDRNLFGAYMTGQPHEHLRAELYVLYLVDGTANGHAYLTTMGTRLDWHPAHWLSGEIEAALQVGAEDKAGHGDRQSLIGSAFFGEIASHVPVGHGSISFAPFTQFYSGAPTPTGNVQTATAWRPLYPSLDQVVGLLQLFKQTNLLQNGGRIRWQAAPTLALDLNGRASASRDNAPLPGFGNPTLTGDGGWRMLGTEFDLLARWQLLRSSELFVGAGLFLPADSVKTIVGKDVASQILAQWTSRF